MGPRGSQDLRSPSPIMAPGDTENQQYLFNGVPRMSFQCKLVPVHYREHEYGLLLPFVWLSS